MPVKKSSQTYLYLGGIREFYISHEYLSESKHNSIFRVWTHYVIAVHHISHLATGTLPSILIVI